MQRREWQYLRYALWTSFTLVLPCPWFKFAELRGNHNCAESLWNVRAEPCELESPKKGPFHPESQGAKAHFDINGQNQGIGPLGKTKRPRGRGEWSVCQEEVRQAVHKRSG